MVVSGFAILTQKLRYTLGFSDIEDSRVICECKRELCLFFSCTYHGTTSENMT